MSERRVSSSALAAVGLVGAVCVATAAAATQIGPSVAALAFSPDRLAHGRIWLLVTSAFVVDHPVALSLASFAALAIVTMFVCGTTLFWRSAVYGHVGGTLIVYSFVGLARLIDHGAFGSTLDARDYGVSAISSAWLATTAMVAWRTTATSRHAKAGIVVACAAVAVFAYMMRRDHSVLSTEHVVAFGLGLAVGATPGAIRSRAASWARPRVAALAAIALVVVGGLATVAEPEALAARLTALLAPGGPSASACVRNWNRSSARRAGGASAVRVDVVRHGRGVTFCVFQFTGGPNRTRVVEAAWLRHGLGPLVPGLRGRAQVNGDVLPDGSIRLAPGREHLDLI